MKNNSSLKTQVAVIRSRIKSIDDGIKEIKENTKDLPVVRNDVKWLKYWHNKIIIGVISALLVSGFLAVYKIAYGSIIG